MANESKPLDGGGRNEQSAPPDYESILSLVPAGSEEEASASDVGFCVCYSRYSSKGQKEDSITRQYEHHVAYANRLSLKMLPGQHHFIDRALTGKEASNRSGLQAMLALARTRAFKYLLIEDIHRLSRRVVDVVTIYEELKKLGIEMIVTGTSSGVVNDMSAVYGGMFAQQQRRVILASTSSGKRQAASRGANMGGIPYGYSKGTKPGDLIVFEPHAQIVRRIFDLLHRGLSPLRVAQLLNSESVPSPAGGSWYSGTIYGGVRGGLIRNTKYCGLNVYDRTQTTGIKGGPTRVLRARKFWKRAQVLDWMIVDPSIWIAVNERLSAATAARTRTSARERGSRTTTSIFSGRYLCGCGARMTYQSQSSSGRLSLICAKSNNSLECNQSRSTSLIWVEYEILSEIEDRIICAEAIDLFRTEYEAELARTQEREAAEIATLRTRIDRLTMWLSRSMVDGVIRGMADEDVVKERQAWTTERERCRINLQKIYSRSKPSVPDPAAMAELRKRIGRLKAELPFKEDTEEDMLLVAALRALVSRVVVRRQPDANPYTLEITSFLAGEGFGETTVERRCRGTSSARPWHIAAVESAVEMARDGRHALDDNEWDRLAPLFKKKQRTDKRTAIDAVLLSLRAGVSVLSLPLPYGGGKIASVVRRMEQTGRLQIVFDVLIAASSPKLRGLDHEQLRRNFSAKEIGT